MSNAPLIYDRVMETSASTGTGPYRLTGAVKGFRAFNVLGDGQSCHYCAQAVDAQGNPSGDWEIGVGTYSAGARTLARTLIFQSTANNGAVNWPSGTRRVFLCTPAATTVESDRPNVFTADQQITGALTVTADVVVAGTSLTAAFADTAKAVHHTTHQPGGADALQVSAASRLLGRGHSAAGPIEELTLSNSLMMTGTELTVRSGIYNYTYNNAIVEPPSAGQARLDAVYPWTAVSKVWLRFVSADGQDLYWGIMLITQGATLLLQDKDEHDRYLRMTTTGDPVDKGLYAELPVRWQANGAAINTAQQVFLRVAGTITSASLQARVDALEARLLALERWASST